MRAASSAPSTDVSAPGRRRQEARDRTADGVERREHLARDRLAERASERELVQVDAERGLAELGVVAAAEPSGELDDLRAGEPDDDLRVRRPVLDPERGGRLARRLDGRADVRGRERARPDVCERDAERRRLRADAVGHGQRVEAPVERERVDGDLLPVDQLLDEAGVRPGCLERGVDGGGEPRFVADEREPTLALAVGRLHDARKPEPFDRGARLAEALAELRLRLRHSRLGEALALTDLRGRQLRDLRRERMREREPLRDARGHRDGPVDPRRDHAVDPLGLGEPFDARLVLGRDDRPAVGERESRRGGIAVDRDHEEVERTGRLEQPELRRAGA